MQSHEVVSFILLSRNIEIYNLQANSDSQENKLKMKIYGTSLFMKSFPTKEKFGVFVHTHTQEQYVHCTTGEFKLKVNNMHL